MTFDLAFLKTNRLSRWGADSSKPILRPYFDSTPNDDRQALEIEDWWNKPYIVTRDWNDMCDTWEAYQERVAGLKLSQPETKAEFIARVRKNEDQWYSAWPTGTRYNVRCLNGGAWDRSTSLAMVGTQEEAIQIAKAYMQREDNTVY